METPNTLLKPRRPLWFFACIAILGFGVFSFVMLKALRPAPEQRDPATLVPSVTTSPLAWRDAPLLVNGNGIVMPTAAIVISSQVSGEVVSLHPQFVSGGALQAGDTMIQIDPRTFEANLEEARANQAANQANLDFLNKQVARLESLRARDFAGEEALDDAISRRAQTQAAIARQEAVILNMQLDLERTSIRAPFSGRIYEESVGLGDIVAPGRELGRFYASDEVEVVVSLNADDAVFIPGLWQPENGERRAWVSVDHGGHKYEWEGYVHRVESDIDRTTRTVDVVVRVRDPYTPGKLVGELDSPIALEAPPLLVGMYADVAIEGMHLPEHFVLPVSALRANNTVWTATAEGILNIVPVEFVRQEGNQAVLLAPDLPEGTPLVTSDIALVSDGMRVQAVPAASGMVN